MSRYLIWLLFFYLVRCDTITEVEIVKVAVRPLKPTEDNTPITKTMVVTEYESSTAPSNNSPSYDPGVDVDFASQMVELHNEKRQIHGATLLSWNNSAFEYAAAYADQYDCSGVLKHSGGSFGENLAIGYTTEGAVNAWYNEGATYVYGSESTYNHFTALIWNSTTSLGCAYKYCNKVWGTYIICSYYPAGNVVGYSSRNVFPPI